MKQSVVTLITILSFISYSTTYGVTQNQTNTAFPQAGKLNNVFLNTFDTIPHEIYGASCYLFRSQQDKDEEKYLCVHDFSSIAFVIINGKMIKLEGAGYNKNGTVYAFKNNDYYLEFEIIKTIQSEYESAEFEGLITIKTKDKVIIKQPIIGTCGW